MNTSTLKADIQKQIQELVQEKQNLKLSDKKDEGISARIKKLEFKI